MAFKRAGCHQELCFHASTRSLVCIVTSDALRPAPAKCDGGLIGHV
jgi:hypothetical protein